MKYSKELKAGTSTDISAPKFPKVLFTIAKRYKQHKQLLIYRQMDKQDVIYTNNGILFSHKKKDVLIDATTWMNLEDINQKENEKT